jgi:hypothetical protein
VIFGTSMELGGEELASKDDIMSLPRLLSWFVLTLYSPNLRRVRRSSARDLFASVAGMADADADVDVYVRGGVWGAFLVEGTEVGAGSAACSLFWLAHSS